MYVINILKSDFFIKHPKLLKLLKSDKNQKRCSSKLFQSLTISTSRYMRLSSRQWHIGLYYSFILMFSSIVAIINQVLKHRITIIVLQSVRCSGIWLHWSGWTVRVQRHLVCSGRRPVQVVFLCWRCSTVMHSHAMFFASTAVGLC